MVDAEMMRKILENTEKCFVEGVDRRLEDGTIQCGVCGEPKTQIGKGIFKDMLLPVSCACMRKEHEKEMQEKRERDRRLRLESLRSDGLTAPAYADKRFGKDLDPKSKVSITCRRYCENWEQMRADNIGLLLYGEVGTGKSFYACCIANDLIDRYCESVYVTTIPRLIAEMQSFDKRDGVMWTVKARPLLVLDDLGAERETSFAEEQLFAIIDTRLLSGKPTIITTNLSLDDIKNPASMAQRRIFDRVLEMCPIQLRCDGRSRRKDAMSARRDRAIKALR